MVTGRAEDRLVKVNVWNPQTKRHVPRWVPKGVVDELAKMKITPKVTEKPKKKSLWERKKEAREMAKGVTITFTAPEPEPLPDDRMDIEYLASLSTYQRVDIILQHVTGWSLAEVTGDRGKVRTRKHIAHVRWLAFYMYCEKENKGLAQTGRKLGFDHSSICHALKNVGDKWGNEVFDSIDSVYAELIKMRDKYIELNNL